MSYHIVYHPDIPKDIESLPQNIKDRIKRSITERLLMDPIYYGDPLRRSLKGYRKLRVGDYRVIYKIESDKIIILKIGHRKDVYSKVQQRIEG